MPYFEALNNHNFIILPAIELEIFTPMLDLSWNSLSNGSKFVGFL